MKRGESRETSNPTTQQDSTIRRECFGRSKYDELGPSLDSSPASPGSEISSGTDFDEHPELVQQLPEYKRNIVAKVLQMKFEKEFPCADEELAVETLRLEFELKVKNVSDRDVKWQKRLVTTSMQR
eukprot:3625667-Amphidinium_carterae.6